MNLSKLFETQRVLDARIELEHPPIQGEDRLAKKVLALLVELGELANEQRSWKFWSNDQEPRIISRCANCSGTGSRTVIYIGYSKNEPCTHCGGSGSLKNPLLEEYVDCLHFILSIGLEDAGSCVWEWDYEPEILKEGDISRQFIGLFFSIKIFANEAGLEQTIKLFIGLGEMLGFTWEQIEQAYYDKNAINHTRQNTGY